MGRVAPMDVSLQPAIPSDRDGCHDPLVAIFIAGRSTCPLCREVVQREDVELFPPGIFPPGEGHIIPQ